MSLSQSLSTLMRLAQHITAIDVLLQVEAPFAEYYRHLKTYMIFCGLFNLGLQTADRLNVDPIEWDGGKTPRPALPIG
ncbi:hypothetical protein ANO14919_145910 [Xylariales sp. No.14919]|nr:hypothetical protein ANO14919_145910 [Xylariales sp. No.14919]